jgi:hypothetical protein
MDKGIVLTGADKNIQARARAANLPVTIDAAMPLAYDKTLFVEPSTRVPWDLLPAAWHFLERWDAAVPLWRYGVNAADVGSKEERARTAAVIRDLRVLLHAVELLFVRDNEDGRALMATYWTERQNGTEKRLSFLRALYQVKPRLCVLPLSWMADIAKGPSADRQAAKARRNAIQAKALVRVEISPGRFVNCREGDEEKVLAQFQQRLKPRHDW